MCFGVDNNGIQRKKVVRGKEEVEVFERFGLRPSEESCQ